MVSFFKPRISGSTDRFSALHLFHNFSSKRSENQKKKVKEDTTVKSFHFSDKIHRTPKMGNQEKMSGQVHPSLSLGETIGHKTAIRSELFPLYKAGLRLCLLPLLYSLFNLFK